MSRHSQTGQSINPIRLHRKSAAFAQTLQRRSGVNSSLCWQCNCCAGGCPFSADMDYRPNQVIRLIQLGMKAEVLQSSAIWLCVGCHTCSMQCPQAIDMASVMDALREMAVQEGVEIAAPAVLKFHLAVLASIRRHGRTHKLDVMIRYKFKARDWISDMDVGLKLLVRRKLNLFPSKVSQPETIRRLFALEEGAAF